MSTTRGTPTQLRANTPRISLLSAATFNIRRIFFLSPSNKFIVVVLSLLCQIQHKWPMLALNLGLMIQWLSKHVQVHPCKHCCPDDPTETTFSHF
jgi:hypothetical protein